MSSIAEVWLKLESFSTVNFCFVQLVRLCFGRDGERGLCEFSGDVCLWSGITCAVADSHFSGLGFYVAHHSGGQLWLLHWPLCAHRCFMAIERGRAHTTLQGVDYSTNIRCIVWELLLGIWFLRGGQCFQNVVVFCCDGVFALPLHLAVDPSDEATSRCQASCCQ